MDTKVKLATTMAIHYTEPKGEPHVWATMCIRK